jgi:tRNA(Ile)-lysidine synthase
MEVMSQEKYVVAVSGGVDSVVLLHMLAAGNLPSSNLIVAHFDHGIRDESADDAEFVRQLAAKYRLQFETKREVLGKNASEEKARDRRYAFLRDVAKKYDGQITTAHHADDIIETIAINLTRGTGWRGLAVLDNPDIYRPLLDTPKKDLIAYAKKHKLQWHEDATNQDTKYLRNSLRQKLTNLDEQTYRLLHLYRDRQVFLRQRVDTEVKRFAGSSPYSRHLLITVSDMVALEVLRAIFIKEIGTSPTRPQLARALHAIKVYQSGKVFEVAAGQTLRFTKTHFVVRGGHKVI